METGKRFLFVSYAREDLDRISPLIDAIRKELAFRALPVELWMDVSNLKPGEQWNASIANALEASIGLLVFLSPRSLRSEWVRRELEAAATQSGRLILPVILHEPLEVPPALAQWQWLRFVGRPTKRETANAAAQVAEATESFLRKTPQPRPPVAKREAPFVAAGMAGEVREALQAAPPQDAPDAVFVVHGHDTGALTQLEEFLGSVGIQPIVLSRQDESPQSLFQKFLAIAGRSRFAIVLLCAEDYGASRVQYEAVGVGDRALQFRARQNVILELGFFYGKLGWESVFVLYKHAERVFPNFERPSDLDGVVFDPIGDPNWQRKLADKLAAAGFELQKPG